MQSTWLQSKNLFLLQSHLFISSFFLRLPAFEIFTRTEGINNWLFSAISWGSHVQLARDALQPILFTQRHSASLVIIQLNHFCQHCCFQFISVHAVFYRKEVLYIFKPPPDNANIWWVRMTVKRSKTILFKQYDDVTVNSWWLITEVWLIEELLNTCSLF